MNEVKFYINGALFLLTEVNHDLDGEVTVKGVKISPDPISVNCRCTLKVKNHSPIKKVVFNDPATIVFWTDGTKTVVKAEGEKYNREKGLAMAIAKKHLGNCGNYYNEFKRWLKDDV